MKNLFRNKKQWRRLVTCGHLYWSRLYSSQPSQINSTGKYSPFSRVCHNSWIGIQTVKDKICPLNPVSKFNNPFMTIRLGNIYTIRQICTEVFNYLNIICFLTKRFEEMSIHGPCFWLYIIISFCLQCSKIFTLGT